jgi:glycosyltransferase involved in cell wall biosynthesis
MTTFKDDKPQGTFKLQLSVLIPAKNEIANISECIKSVAFADEIIVVDSQSTDGTQDAALSLGAKIVQFDWNGQFPKKKNWALENIQWGNEWILIIDADERITPELEREIRYVIEVKELDGYYINRRFMFMGGWIKHCGYYPSWNLRLFKHGAGRYERLSVGDTHSGDNEVHEHLLLDGKAGYLKNDMLHYAYPSIDVWIEKHNRYSNWEARVPEKLHDDGRGDRLAASPVGNALQRKRWLKKAARHLPFRPSLRFFYHFVVKQGFRDGYRGWVFCRLLAWYEFVSMAKAQEIKMNAHEDLDNHSRH